ncbi:hypothetical protein THRCLA_06124 [Thraustotheca clavata]|uniref:Bzip transcription factor n=1 Tax=Thraustotheca clavata TaxID=74557 RepID=A0A1V9ZQC8_9STRA|nr:hypothetical protein THRCLA_06124 [Thraustotheca clavata]
MPQKSIEEKNARRRTQSRHNQRRYRQEYRDYIESLENDVSSLKISIARLDGQLSGLRSTLRLHEPKVNVAFEFFRIFRRSSYFLVPSQAQKQRDFLKSVMVPEIQFMEQTGIAKVFEQLTMYHTLFYSFELTTSVIDIVVTDGNAIVRAPAVIDLQISRTTIEALFPLILSNEFLVQKLIGRLLSLPILLHFHYDENDQIVMLDTFTDITTSFAQLLKNIPDTLLLIQGGGGITKKAELRVADVSAL